MPENPVDHIPAVARAGRADAVFVEIWICLQNFRHAVRDVGEGFAAPIGRKLR